MSYVLTQRLSMTTDGDVTNLSPSWGILPGDPEEAWKRRIFRLREQRLTRAPEDVQKVEAGHAGGVWWIEFSDAFNCWSVDDGKHVSVTTQTRLEYEEATS